jgi:arylsulfatase A-like enzyme
MATKGRSMVWARVGWRATVLGLALVGVFGARPGPAAQPTPKRQPNIVFLVADDLATRLGCYGDQAAITPHLDRLAAEGVVFTHAYCQGGVCTPSRTSFMLGLNNRHAGADHFRKHPDTMTLGRWFREHGYQTFSVGKIDHTDEFTDPQAWDIRVTQPELKPKPGLGQRTRLEEDQPQPDGTALGREFSLVGIANSADQLRDWAVADRAIRFLASERDQAKPFFAAVGFTLPHVPWDSTRTLYEAHEPARFTLERLPADATPLPPGAVRDEPGLAVSESRQREAMRAYYAAASSLDEQVGRVLEKLAAEGLAEDTIVVFTSDHGYHLGWRGQWCKHSIDEQVMRVPLIVRHPRGAKASTADGIVELLDLFPTFCDMAGLPAPATLDGKSFLPLVEDPSATGKPAAFCSWNGRTVRTPRWRYIERLDGSRELYDHEHDPAEYHNVIDQPAHDAIARELAASLEEELGPRRIVPRQRPAKSPVLGADDTCPLPGSFAGVGMILGIEDRRIVIKGVLPDTPAARGGLAAGLVVASIDGIETEGSDLGRWLDMIRGQPGTKVRLGIVDRAADRMRTVELVREKLPALPLENAPGPVGGRDGAQPADADRQ